MSSGVNGCTHPVHAHVIDDDAPFGQQLLDIPVRKRVAQIPTNRHQDHVRWIPEPSEARPQCWYSTTTTTHPILPDFALHRRNSPLLSPERPIVENKIESAAPRRCSW